MSDLTCKLLIIGAGPGGYICGIRAGQLGIDTIVVDDQKPGGTCLNVGCIPSKALIHAADEFHKVKRFAAGNTPLGISAASPAIDLKHPDQEENENTAESTSNSCESIRNPGGSK